MKDKKNNIKKIALRALAILGATLALLLIFAYGTMYILVHGPSPTARRLFVLSVKETSAGGFLADIYLSDEEIDAILAADGAEEKEEELDLSLIQLPTVESETSPTSPSEDNTAADTDEPETNSPSDDVTDDGGIEVIDIVGSTYNGKMLVIKDPTRVFVGVPDSYGATSSGLTVRDMITKYGAVAGTNAGGFYDPNGSGTGGIPEGIVIYEGELLWGSPDGYYSLAGLDSSGILHVGVMSGKQALDRGIKYAASYGPALVINGKYAGASWGLGGGLNPRTAIGQRADGAILLLVINGRSVIA